MLDYFQPDAVLPGRNGRSLAGVALVHIGQLDRAPGYLLKLLGQRGNLRAVALVGRGDGERQQALADRSAGTKPQTACPAYKQASELLTRSRSTPLYECAYATRHICSNSKFISLHDEHGRNVCVPGSNYISRVLQRVL